MPDCSCFSLLPHLGVTLPLRTPLRVVILSGADRVCDRRSRRIYFRIGGDSLTMNPHSHELSAEAGTSKHYERTYHHEDWQNSFGF